MSTEEVPKEDSVVDSAVPLSPAAADSAAPVESVQPEESAPVEAEESNQEPVDAASEEPAPDADGAGDKSDHRSPSNDGATSQDKLKFFVGGLHPSVDESVITSHFCKYGRIISAQVMRDFTTGRSRGFAFVTVQTQDNSDDVFTDEHTLNGKRVDVRHLQSDAATNMKRKIFVGGISKSLSEQMLEDYFSRFGAIDKVTIMRQIDGSSRGFGFIMFAVDGAVEKVLESPSHFVYGSKVDVRAAETRSKQAAARFENQYKSMMQHAYKPNNYGKDRNYSGHQMGSHYGQSHKMPHGAPSNMMGYDAQLLQQHLMYQQYALQSQYAYYAQQPGAHSAPAGGALMGSPYGAPPGAADHSRYGSHRPTNFGHQPNSQNNIAPCLTPKRRHYGHQDCAGFSTWAGIFTGRSLTSVDDSSRKIEAHIVASHLGLDSINKKLKSIGANISTSDDITIVESCTQFGHESGLVFINKNGSVVLWNDATSTFDHYRKLLEDNVVVRLQIPKPILAEFSEFINMNGDGKGQLPKYLSSYTLDSNIHTQVAVSMALMTAVQLNRIEYEIRVKIMVNNAVLEKLRNDLSGRNLDQLTKRLFEFQAYAHGRRYWLNLDQDLLEIPNSIWDDEHLRSLFSAIQSSFAMPQRLEKLNQRITWELESLESHSEYVRHKHASRLEKIIIFLITVEIVLGISQMALKCM
ncbi:RNA recognition motif domain containing protein [Babesia ovis]|uniref:RNA recognition motif domain containing protein n=1 Tax=Babesia ovis TaxID=5869 RepID=A0A9W5WU25_BABOV|nr:RNA recognition motif domain containing protein [Babesia ovis]